MKIKTVLKKLRELYPKKYITITVAFCFHYNRDIEKVYSLHIENVCHSNPQTIAEFNKTLVKHLQKDKDNVINEPHKD